MLHDDTAERRFGDAISPKHYPPMAEQLENIFGKLRKVWLLFELEFLNFAIQTSIKEKGRIAVFSEYCFWNRKPKWCISKSINVKIEQLYWRLNLPRSQGATHSSLSACLMMVSGRGREWRTMAPYSPYSAMMLPRPHVLEVFRSLARRFWNQTCHSNHVSIIVVLLPHPRLSLGPSFHLNGRADC